jgi:two-component system sensor kinase FixL
MRKSKHLKRQRPKPARGRSTRVFGAGAELRALMDAAVDAIIVIDDDGLIVSFSPAAERMFGYAAHEIVGEPLDSLMPEPYHSEHDSYLRRYQSTRVPHIIGIGREVEAKRRNGEVFPVLLSVGEARSGSGQRFVGIVRDLTSQRAQERERHALEARLAHVGRLSLMGEMAAGIAHEINQPLSAINNYSQAAKNMLEHVPVEEDALRSACRGIADQVQRAGQVVENLRNFVRKREIETQPLDLNEMIKGAMTLVSVDATNANVIVQTHFASELPGIEGNSVQLQQVLLNLTRNAVDAMKGTRGRLREITITTRRSGPDSVEFEVRDTGPGISSSLADAIFHPFFTTKSDGLGVGLAISRSIVEAHAGTLSYMDNAGGGAVFVVRLPVKQNERET